MTRRTAILRKALKLGFGLAIIVLVLKTSDATSLPEVMARARAMPMILGLICLIVASLSQIVRLQVLAGPWLSTKESARITMVSSFLNQLLPGAIAGEVYRASRLKKASREWTTALALIGIERVLGVIILLLPATVYALMENERLIPLFSTVARVPHLEPRRAALFAVVFILIAVVAGWVALRGHRNRVAEALGRMYSVARCIPPVRYVWVIVLSASFHVLRVTGLMALLASLGSHVAAADLLLVLAASIVVSTLPISVGSLGVREGAITFGLRIFGVSPSVGLAVALLNRVALVAVAAAGGIVYWRDLKSIQHAQPDNDKAGDEPAIPSVPGAETRSGHTSE